MTDKKKTLRDLQVLMKADDLAGFQALYNSCGFDIAGYQSWSGLSAQSLFIAAMIDNKPGFADFLVGKLGVGNIAGLEASYTHPANEGICLASMLYLAIRNNMEDLALKLIRHPKTDLERGLNLKTTQADIVVGVIYQVAHVDETLLDAAMRTGNRAVTEALYNEHIARLENKAEDLQNNALLFKSARADRVRKKIIAFEQARDALLKPIEPKQPSPPSP